MPKKGAKKKLTKKNNHCYAKKLHQSGKNNLQKQRSRVILHHPVSLSYNTWNYNNNKQVEGSKQVLDCRTTRTSTKSF